MEGFTPRRRRYLVIGRVYHDRLYTRGTIELTDDEAEPLLELGTIIDEEPQWRGDNEARVFGASEPPALAEPTLDERFRDVVGHRAHASLTAAGLASPSALHLTSDPTLEALDAVGKTTIRNIRSFLREHGETLGLTALDAAVDARIAARAAIVEPPADVVVETGTGAGAPG